MRIWLIQRAEPTPHDGDGTRRIMRIGMLATILSKRGHKVIWWTSGFDHIAKRHRIPENLGSSIRRSTKEGYEIHYTATRGYTKNISIGRFLDNRRLTKNMALDMSKEKNTPDLIFASIPSVELANAATDYGKKHAVPVVLDIRDLYPDVFIDLVPTFLRPIIKIASSNMRKRMHITAKAATAICGITDEFVDWGVAHARRQRNLQDKVFRMAYPKLKRDYNNEIGASFWKNKLLATKRNSLHVLFLGSFSDSFDFETPLKAAQLLLQKKSPVYFTFCGTGTNESFLRAKALKLSNVDIVGWVDSPQIQWALENADIGLASYISSPNFSNNITNKPAEYLSGELVVATSLTQGPLIDMLDRSGIGFTYGTDANRLANKLSYLQSNPKELKKIKKKALSVFQQNFRADQVYEELAIYLENLV